MNINFSGYRENVLTFECESNVMPGKLVKMADSGKVGTAGDGDPFIGKALCVRDGYAAVQLEGYLETYKTGFIHAGYNKLVAASIGVKADEDGIDRLVIYVDDTKVGFIL